MPLEPEPDLPWTAFLYVAGELSTDEASAFERLLADDQSAREAVAQAVELAGALAIIGSELGPKRRSIRRRVFAGAVVIAAAAGLILATLPALRPIGLDRPDSSEVALAWSGLRGVAEADHDNDWLHFDSVPTASSPEPVETIDEETEFAAPADRALPSWLLTAASATVGQPPRQED